MCHGKSSSKSGKRVSLETPNSTRANQTAADQAVIIADNAALNQTSSEFCLPIVTYTTVETDGVRELRGGVMTIGS